MDEDVVMEDDDEEMRDTFVFLPDLNTPSRSTSILKRKSCSESEDLSDSDSQEEVSEVLRRIKRIKFPVYIKIQTLNGRVIEIDLDSSDTVGRIQEILVEKEGIPLHQQRLIFAGKALHEHENDRVSTIGIINGSVVFLIVALPNRAGYSGVFQEHRR